MKRPIDAARPGRPVAQPRPRFRLVALDCDGTVVRPDGTISPRVVEAVRAAVAAGCRVTLATGRRFPAASRVAAALGLRAPLILHNGCVIQDSATAAVLYEDALDPDRLAPTVEHALAHGQQPVLYESPARGGRLFVGPAELDTPGTRRYLETRTSAQPVVRLPVERLGRLPHILSVGIFAAGPARLPELQAAVQADEACSTVLMPPGSMDTAPVYGLEIFAHGCGKGRALAYLADHLGVPLAEVLAVGDQVNDLDLLRTAGLGLAMADAPPSVQAFADAVVAGCLEDGVAEALERYILGGGTAS